jgi:hypothetical protein
MALVDEGRQIAVISLRLCIINLRSGGRRRPDEGETRGYREAESRHRLSVAFIAL